MADNLISPDGVAGNNLNPLPLAPTSNPVATSVPVYTYSPEDSKYTKDFVPGSISPFENFLALEEHKAQQQSNLNRWASAIPRLVLTTGTKLGTGAGYIAGGIGGLIKAAQGADQEEVMDTMLNNAWSQFFENAEETVKTDWFPILKTKNYLNGNIWKQMGTASFWTDDVIDGLAFMASTYVPGVGLAKLGTGAKIASTFANGLKSAKLGKYIKGAVNVEKLAKGLDLVGTTALATSAEAGFEAKDSWTQTLNALKEFDPDTNEWTGKYKLANGEYIDESHAKQIAAETAADTYRGNLVALAASNMFESGMLLGTFAGGRKVLKSLDEKIVPLTLKQKAGSFFKGVLSTAAMEGPYEENIQLAMQNYYRDKGTGKIKEPGIENIFFNMFDNFTTDEGQKNIVMGSLVGLIPGGIGNMHESIANNEKAARLQKAINDSHSFYYPKKADVYKQKADGEIYLNEDGKPVIDPEKVAKNWRAFKGMQHRDMLKQEAIKNGNEEFYNYLQDSELGASLYNYLSTSEGLELFDNNVEIASKEDLENENSIRKTLSLDEIGLDDLIKSRKAKAREFKKIYDTIDSRDVFLAKLKNDKVGNKLREELKFSLYNEAVRQTVIKDTLNKINGKIADIKANNSEESLPKNDEYAELTYIQEQFNNALKESEARYADLSNSRNRAEIVAASYKAVEEQEKKEKAAEQVKKEINFAEKVRNTVTEDAIDENNKYPNKEESLKEAKGIDGKKAEEIIDKETKLAAQRKIEKGTKDAKQEQTNPPVKNKEEKSEPSVVASPVSTNTSEEPEVPVASPRKLKNSEVIALVNGKLGRRKGDVGADYEYFPNVVVKPGWVNHELYKGINAAIASNNEKLLLEYARGISAARAALPNDNMFKHFNNVILEHYGYDVNEGITKAEDTQDGNSTSFTFTGGVSDDSKDVNLATDAKDTTDTISEFIASSADGINIFLSEFKLGNDYNNADLVLSAENTNKYNLLKDLKPGSTLEMSIDTDQIKDGKSLLDEDKKLDEDTIPIKITIPGQKSKFHLNRVGYQKAEIAFTDILLNSVKSYGNTFQQFANTMLTQKHGVVEWTKILYPYFGEGGLFITDAKSALYDKSFLNKSGEVRDVLTPEQSSRFERDVKHIKKVLTRAVTNKANVSGDDFTMAFSKWRDRLSADLNNSITLRKTLWNKYKNDDLSPINVTVARTTHGSFNHVVDKNGIKTLRKVSKVFGNEENIDNRISSYKLATVHTINKDRVNELYAVESANDEKATPIFVNKGVAMAFKPGQIYLITNETMNDTEFPVLLEYDTLKEGSSELSDVVGIVSQMIEAMHKDTRSEIGASLKDIRNAGLVMQLRKYINVVTAYDAKSTEFRIWGDSYDANKNEAPRRVLSFVDKNGIDYDIFTRDSQGNFINRTENGEVIDATAPNYTIYKREGTHSEKVDTSLAKLLEGKFRNVVISEFKNNPTYRREVLEGTSSASPALMTSIAKVIDDKGNKVGVAQISGRYPFTVNIGEVKKEIKVDKENPDDKTAPATDNISTISSDDIDDDIPDNLDEIAFSGENYGLLQSLPVNGYNEEFLYDYFGVYSKTKNGTEILISKVVSFVEQFGTELDNEFLSLLNATTKGLKVIVDNRESDDNNKVTISYYNPTTKTFGINLDYFIRGDKPLFKSELAHAFSHENIHLITLRGLNESSTFNGEMTELFTIAKESTGDKFSNITNVKEFIAEAISNPAYSTALENITYKAENLSIWAKFVSYIKRLMNFILGYPSEANLFEKTLNSLRKEIKTNGIRIVENGNEIALEGEAAPEFDRSDEKFSAEERRLAVNWLLAQAQKVIVASNGVTRQDIINKKEEDLRQQLITRAQVRLSKAEEKLTQYPDKKVYKDIKNFWTRVISNLTNNHTDTGLYDRVKSEYEYLYNVEIDDYDSLNDLLQQSDENRSSLTRGWDEDTAYSRGMSATYEPLTRYVIATLEEARYDKNKEVVKKINRITGSTEYVNYSGYKNKLQSILANSTSEDEVFYKLNELSKYLPSVKFLIDKLQSDNDIKQAFLSDMMKVFPTKGVLLIDKEPNGNVVAKYEIENKAHSYDIANTWINQLRHDIALGKIDLNTIENATLRIKGDGDKIPSLETTLKEDFNKGVEILSNIFKNLDIAIHSDYIKTHFENVQKERFKESEESIESINNTILNTEYISRLERIIKNIRGNLTAENKKKAQIQEYGTFNALASTLSKYTIDFIEPSAPNIHGDIEWGYRLPTFITRFYAEAKSDYPGAKQKFLERLKEYARTPEGRQSNVLWTVHNEGRKGFLNPKYNGYVNGKYSYDFNPDLATLDEDFINNFDIHFLGGVKNRVSGEGDSYTEMTDLDFRFASLVNYVVRGDADNGEYIRIPGIILGDSSQATVFKLHKFFIAKSDVINANLSNFAISKKSNMHLAIDRIAKQEINRVIQAIHLLYNVDANGERTIKPIEQLKNEGVYSHLLENQHYKVVKGEIVFEEFNKETKRLEPVGNLFKFYNIPALNENKETAILYDDRGLLRDNINKFPEYMELISKQIDAYITELVADGYHWYNHDQYRDFIKNHTNTATFEQIIPEMILNYFIYNVEQQNLFNGGTCEFKDVLDTVKRSKAVNSGGKSNSTNGVSKVAIVKDDVIASKIIDGYRTLAIAELKKRGLKSGTPEFDTQLHNILKDYEKINIADGQGFITENTWISRQIAAGHGRDIAPMIEQYTQNGKIKYRFKSNLKFDDFITVPQVDKPFVSARYYDSILNRMVRKQLKLSEAILFRDTIKDTQLEEVADWMEANDVDEFLFASTEKEGLNPMTELSVGGAITNKSAFGSITTFYYNNEDRYAQLEVPDAIVDEKTKVGVQIRKHTLSNINPDNIYHANGDLSGKQAIEEYNDLISQNIIESLNKLKSEILNADNKLSTTEVSNILVKQFNARNRSANAKDSVRYNQEEDKFEMNLSFNGHRKAIISTLTSLFTNNITNQKMPGGHVVLMSDVLSGVSDEKVKFYGEEQLIAEGKIKPLPRRLTVTKSNVNGLDTTVVECRLPAYSKKFFRNGDTIDVNELPDELKTFIGYRIPTSGKHSTVILKVVEFLPRVAGSLIVTADDVVARMNSDFDVDSLFLILPSFKINALSPDTKKAIETNFDLIVNALSASGLQNRIIGLDDLDVPADVKVNAVIEEIERTLKKDNEYLTQEDIGFLDAVERSFIERFDSETVIDTLPNGLKLEYVYDKYDTKDNNTVNSRNNRILELMMAIIGSEHHLVEGINPANYNTNKKVTNTLIQTIEEEQEDYNPVSHTAQLRIRRKAINGKSVLPIAATWNTGATVLQVLRAQLARVTNGTQEDFINSGIPIKYDIKKTVADLKDKSLNTQSKIDAKVNNLYKSTKKLLNEKYDKKDIIEDRDNKTFIVVKRNIAWNEDGSFTNELGSLYTEILGEDVDNAADTLKGNLPCNVNDYTYNVWAMLKVIHGDTDYAGYFINQPAVRRLFNNYKIAQGILESGARNEMHQTIKELQTMLFNELVKQDLIILQGVENAKVKKDPSYVSRKTTHDFADSLAERIKRNKTLWFRLDEEKDKFYDVINTALSKINLNYSDNDTAILSKEELLEQIQLGELNKKGTLTGVDKVSYLLTQLGVLNRWSSFNGHAKAISNTIRVTNVDKLGASPSFRVTNNMEKNIADASVNNIISADPQYEGDTISNVVFKWGGYRMLSTFWKSVNETSAALLRPLFLTESSAFKWHTYRFENAYRFYLGDRTDFVVGKLEDYIMNTILSKHPFFDIDDETRARVLGINNPVGVLSTAEKLENLRTKLNIKPDEAHILNVLNGNIDPNSQDRYGFHKIDTKLVRKDPFIDDEITRSMWEMYFKGSPEEKEFISELVLYSYLVDKLAYGRNSFVQFIPLAIFKDIGVDKYLNDVESIINNSDEIVKYLPTTIADDFILDNAHLDYIVPRVSTAWIDAQDRITVNNTPVWEPNYEGNIVVNTKQLSRVDNKLVQDSKYIKKYYRGADNEKNFFVVYEEINTGDKDTTVYTPILRFNAGNTLIKDRINPVYTQLDNNIKENASDLSNKKDSFSKTYRGLRKVISGGQTGADMAGLDAARKVNVATGGTAAGRYSQSVDKRTLISNLELRDKYGLKEGKVVIRQGKSGPYEDIYHQRTVDNAQEADATIWFGDPNSPGGLLTLGREAQFGKIAPLVNPGSAQQINKWLNDNHIEVINIAGNREWTNPGITNYVQTMLEEAFKLNISLENILSATELINYNRMSVEEKRNFLDCL